MFKNILRALRGAALVEYSMVVGLIAILAIFAVMSNGRQVSQTFCVAAEAIAFGMTGEAGKYGCSTDGVPVSSGPPAIPPRVIIPTTYNPQELDFVLIYEGFHAGFLLTSNTGGLIEWGDGRTTAIISGNNVYNISYLNAGPHQVNITGNVTAFSNIRTIELTEVVSFGTVGILSLTGAFTDADNLRRIADLPDTVTDLSLAFELNDAELADVADWNVGNVTNMRQMFNQAGNFNADIAYWDVSSVEDMANMFTLATNFNAEIGAWDISSAQNLTGLFDRASSFDQDISNWNTLNVTNLEFTFRLATAFNSPIGAWDVSNVRNLAYTFSSATSFNQPLNTWDVSNVQDMSGTFDSATAFNQPLNDWVPLSIPNRNAMHAMFANTPAFAQNLSSWCVNQIISHPSFFSHFSAITGLPLWGQPCS